MQINPMLFLLTSIGYPPNTFASEVNFPPIEKIATEKAWEWPLISIELEDHQTEKAFTTQSSSYKEPTPPALEAITSPVRLNNLAPTPHQDRIGTNQWENCTLPMNAQKAAYFEFLAKQSVNRDAHTARQIRGELEMRRTISNMRCFSNSLP
ncbi:hypothetical protein [Paludibacterium purpuratum]|uniref:Uncharacterized protein n=1 Tax=Paludibacterium purpuratum TaxID=1144873 RepID=A0A4R7BA85_9NEIS|nr:hypothetical protein [Paludibacterium purpuratum]TDR81493.1 hypothetical protein DFP86_103146 [Paludibacterium purpuratum]